MNAIELAGHDLCTGCGACAAKCPKQCISMHENAIGIVLPVIYLCQTAEAQDRAGCRVVKDAGIEDFLGYVANADMVVTESFHGTVFSLILGTKNVFVHIVSNRRGSRIEDLLDTFCLKSHILPPDFSASYGYLEKMRVNARKVSDMIISERNRSVAFLEKCING